MAEEIIDAISDGKNYHPVIAETVTVLDVLDRKPFIDNILRFIGQVSQLKGSSTIAINGEWGSGKTFVLNQIERQLREYQDGNRYLVIHYNCWQFDYYEEPLIAIVSIVKESLEEQERLFPANLRNKINGFIRILGDIAATVLLMSASSGITIGMAGGVSNVSSILTHTATDNELKKSSFDPHAGFNSIVDKLKTYLASITEDITVVFAVDEIDRCLPSYAIRVLERLHHLFSELPNSVVLITEDKEQLTSIVEQLFGTLKPDEYLRKFINFSFDLDKGKVNDFFPEK